MALPEYKLDVVIVDILRDKKDLQFKRDAEAEIVRPSEVAAWIVPGLAFTIQGDRLGYGGGWYDRLMAGAKGSFKIGVAHDFQIVENLPHEPHDIQLIRIVTDDLSDKHIESTTTASTTFLPAATFR